MLKSNKISTIYAKELLVSERIDLIAKLLYIKAKEEKLDTDFFTDLYKATISAFSDGTFVEPGNDKKTTFDDYVIEFNKIIVSIRENGFIHGMSLVPVNSKNIIVNGAHRVATAIYYEKKVETVDVGSIDIKYDVNYFKKQLLDKDYIIYLLYQYCKLKFDIHVICIWPKCSDEDKEEIETIIYREFKVIYNDSFCFTYQGFRNFMLQTYRNFEWIGNSANHFKGLNGKVESCYSNNRMRFYIIEENDLRKITAVKTRIRNIIGKGNDSIHSTDTYNEAIEMLGILLNSNSIRFLNLSIPDKYPILFENLLVLKRQLEKKRINYEDIMIDSSSVMALYGIRENRDIDYLSKCPNLMLDNAECHNEYIKYYGKSIDDLMFNPSNYFYYFGTKFITLDNIKFFKERRNEMKDKEDIFLINQFLCDGHTISKKVKGIYISWKRFIRREKLTIKRILRKNKLIYAIYTFTIKKLFF